MDQHIWNYEYLEMIKATRIFTFFYKFSYSSMGMGVPNSSTARGEFLIMLPLIPNF